MVRPRDLRRPLAALVLLSCLLIGFLAPTASPPLSTDSRAHHLSSAVRVLLCPVTPPKPGTLGIVKDGEGHSFGRRTTRPMKLAGNGPPDTLSTYAVTGHAHLRGHCNLQPSNTLPKLLRVVAVWEADFTFTAGKVAGHLRFRPLHPTSQISATQWTIITGTAHLTRGELTSRARPTKIDELRLRLLLAHPGSQNEKLYWSWAPNASSNGSYAGAGGFTIESRIDACVSRRTYGLNGQGRIADLALTPITDEIEPPAELAPSPPPDPWRDSFSLLRDLTTIQDGCQARVTGLVDLPPVTLLGVLDRQPAGDVAVPLLLAPPVPNFWRWLENAPHTQVSPDNLPLALLRQALPGPGWQVDQTPTSIHLSVGNYLAKIPLAPATFAPISQLPPWDPSTDPDIPTEPLPATNTILLVSSADLQPSTKAVISTLHRLLTADIRLTPVAAPIDALAPIFWALCAASGAAVAQFLAPRSALAAGAGALAVARALCPDPVLTFLLGFLSWAAGVCGSSGVVRWKRMLPSTSPLPAGVLNHFDDITPVARGGMGMVYHAVRAATGTGVHIKMMLEEARLDPDSQLRFQREMRALSQLDHPNVVRILEHQSDGVPYYVMEDFSSETLEQLLARSAPLPLREVLQVGIGLADGLAAVHAAGIIHRDIKPDNVLVSPSGEVQLIDFGLAMIEGMTRLTREDGLNGTLRYMAPELLAGGSPTPGSDLYSLGVVLYRAVTAQLPYGENTVDKITYAPLPPIPTAIGPAIARCLAPPADRFPSATELAAALRQVKKETDD